MAQPQIFISAVSSEYKTLRRMAAEVVTRLGYTPATQEIFGTEAGDLRQVLRDKIDPCDGLIQIVGRGYGAEPPTVDPEYGRVSYTQFELLYARGQGKKVWIIIAGDECLRDKPLEQLDLPPDPAHSDPAGYQRERRELQEKYRAAREGAGDLFHPAASNHQLLLIIEQLEKLKEGIAEYRKRESRWRKRVIAALAALLLLAAVSGGGLWWLGHGQANIRKNLADLKAAQQITREKVRAKLMESAERTHQESLQEADKAATWQERKKRRDATEAEHTARLSRIDAVAQEFADIEGSKRATAVFDELKRILQSEKGSVDQALAYMQTQQPEILSRVRARAEAAHQKNRDELKPVLLSARLRADKGKESDASEAGAAFDNVLALEPDWPEALEARFWFRIGRADHAKVYATLSDARRLADLALNDANHLAALTTSKDSNGQRLLSVSLDCIGDVQKEQGDLKGALASYQKYLAIAEKLAAAESSNAQVRRDVCWSCGKIANVLEKYGDEQATAWWTRARDGFEAMKAAGMYLSPKDEAVLNALNAKLQAK